MVLRLQGRLLECLSYLARLKLTVGIPGDLCGRIMPSSCGRTMPIFPLMQLSTAVLRMRRTRHDTRA